MCACTLVACASNTPAPPADSTGNPPTDDAGGGGSTTDDGSATRAAVVEGVEVSGEAGAYTFAVTLRSPDTGCDQYADWWEVATADGELVYRRILAHSHVDEQPFTRSGGPVEVGPDAQLVVRGHMSTTGYGDQALRGTVTGGFEPAQLAGFAADLAQMPPLPADCAF